MRVLVIGCGAVGSIFAAHLARSDDVEVWAYDTNEPHVEAIRRQGLRLSGQVEMLANIHATVDADELPPADFGILATKSIHTDAAMRAVSHALMGPSSAVCSVQNGIGNEEIAAQYVKYVVRGTTFPAGRLIGPGRVSYDIAGETWIGPFEPTATPMPLIERLAVTLEAAGLPTHAMSDARGAQWTKFIFNTATNGVGALTQLHHAAATRLEPTRELFDGLLTEGRSVASAAGISLHHDPQELVTKAAEAPGEHKSSMLQDVLARRQTEVDFLNGALVEWGTRLMVATPLNRTVWALVKGLEHSWTLKDEPA